MVKWDYTNKVVNTVNIIDAIIRNEDLNMNRKGLDNQQKVHLGFN